jgi:hypothetical protein
VVRADAWSPKCRLGALEATIGRKRRGFFLIVRRFGKPLLIGLAALFTGPHHLAAGYRMLLRKQVITGINSY